MNKSSILLALGISVPSLIAGTEIIATPPTQENISVNKEASVDQVTVMQKQISELQKKLAEVANKLNEHNKKEQEWQQHAKEHKEPTLATESSPKQAEGPVFDKGYFNVPGTTLGLKLGGMVKLDTIYDAKSNTSEQTQTNRLPYDITVANSSSTNTPNNNNNSTWKKHFYAHAKQSKIRVDSVAKNSSGRDIKAFVEFDFFGSTNWGDTAVNGSSALSSTNYTCRLRHALLEYCGFEAGHTTTTFWVNEINLPSVDLNGVNGGYNRHALARYTHKFGDLAVTAAAEHSRPDYVQFNNTGSAVRYTYFTQDGGVNLGKPERPDFVLRALYKFTNGSLINLSGVYRDLRIKANTGTDQRNYSTTAVGVNLCAKIITFGKSYFTGGIVTGKGIGWYLSEANGRSAFFDNASNTNSPTYRAIPMTMFWAGYSHVWNPQWQTSIGAARINLNTRSFNDEVTRTVAYNVSDPGIDNTFNKFIINTLYKPEENLEFGLEFFWLQRVSVNTNRGTGVNAGNGLDSNKGTGQRLQFAASYKF